MNLKDLNKTIHINLLTSELIEESISDSYIIAESNNKDSETNLKEVEITGMPTNNCWIFNHETKEQDLRSDGSLVERTILFLSEKNELYLIFIEMKSQLKFEYISKCRQKLESSLTHISIYLATNNHTTPEYKDCKIKFKFFIFCNGEKLKDDGYEKEPICKEFIDYKTESKDYFLTKVHSSSLGIRNIKSKQILEKKATKIITKFQDLLK